MDTVRCGHLEGQAHVRRRVGRTGIEVDFGSEDTGLTHADIGQSSNLLPSLLPTHLQSKFYKFLSSQNENLVPNPVRLVPGDLDNVVPDGFALLGSNVVSARNEGPERTAACSSVRVHEGHQRPETNSGVAAECHVLNLVFLEDQCFRYDGKLRRPLQNDNQ